MPVPGQEQVQHVVELRPQALVVLYDLGRPGDRPGSFQDVLYHVDHESYLLVWYLKVRPGCSPGLLVRGSCGPGPPGPCYSGSRCFIGISVGLALVEGLPAAGWASWVPDRSMWAPSVERGGGGIKKSGRVARPACWSVGHVARGRRAVLFRIALLHRHLRWSGVGGGLARRRLGQPGFQIGQCGLRPWNAGAVVSKSQAGLLARPAGPWVMWPGAAGPSPAGLSDRSRRPSTPGPDALR